MNIIRRLLLSVLAGVFVGAVMMYLAWEHNPQCEFHCEGTIYWGHWFLIGVSWAIPVVVVLFIVPLLVMGIIRICLGDTFFRRNNAPTIDDLRQHFLSEKEWKIVRRESEEF